MNRELIFFAEFNLEDPFYVNYYLTIQPIDGGFLYGVSLEKVGAGNCEDEYSYANDIYRNREKTLQFINLLYDYRVTPMSLLEIVDDYLATEV